MNGVQQIYNYFFLRSCYTRFVFATALKLINNKSGKNSREVRIIQKMTHLIIIKNQQTRQKKQFEGE